MEKAITGIALYHHVISTQLAETLASVEGDFETSEDCSTASYISPVSSGRQAAMVLTVLESR